LAKHLPQMPQGTLTGAISEKIESELFNNKLNYLIKFGVNFW